MWTSNSWCIEANAFYIPFTALLVDSSLSSRLSAFLSLRSRAYFISVKMPATAAPPQATMKVYNPALIFIYRPYVVIDSKRFQVFSSQ